MRVVFLLTTSLESPYGLGRCLPFARQLAAQGHDVHLVALHHDLTPTTVRNFSLDGVQVHYAGQMHVRKRGDVTTYFRSWRLLWVVLTGCLGLTWSAIRLRADVYHIGKPHPQNSVAGLIAARLTGRRRVLVLDYDDLEAAINRFSGNWQQRLAGWLEDHVPFWVDGVTVHSSYLQLRLQRAKLAPGRMLSLPSCVAPERFANIDSDVQERWRAQLAIDDCPVVVYVGTLALHNHPVDLLLEAFALLLQRLPTAILLIVGGGADLAAVRSQAERLGIAPHCRFTGRVEGAAVPHLLRLAQVSVDPVVDDPVARARWPLKIVESMAAGVPVVTGAVGDRQLMLGNGLAGILVKPGDAVDLATALETVLADPALQRQLELGCLTQARQFDVRQLTQQLVDFYARLGASGPSSPMTASQPSSFSYRKVLFNIGALTSGVSLARVLAAIAVVLLARQVGPTAFGQYAASMTLAKLSATLFSLGLDSLLLRNSGRANSAQLAELTTTTLSIKLGLGLLWLFAITLIAPQINSFSFPQEIVLLCALVVWFEELATTAWSAFQAKLAGGLTSVLMVLTQALVLLSTLWLMGLNEQNLAAYLGARVVAVAIGCAISLGLMVQRIKWRFAPDAFGTTLRATLPFAASLALSAIYGSADVLLVAALLGPGASGVYAPAVTIVSILFMVPASIYGVTLPVLSRSYQNADGSFGRLAKQLIWAHVGLGLVMGGGLYIVAGTVVLAVLGAAYAATVNLLQILSIVLALHCVSFALATILIVVGWQGRRVQVQALAAVVNVGLNLMLITYWGVIGVAWIYVVSDLVLVAGYWSTVWLWQRTAHQQPVPADNLLQ